MAIVRADFTPDEAAEILALIGPQGRSGSLYRARRSLARALEQGRGAEAAERENLARLRRNRRIITADDAPLTPRSMSRFVR